MADERGDPVIDIMPDRPSALPVGRRDTGTSRLAGRQWVQRYEAALAEATRCRSVGAVMRSVVDRLPGPGTAMSETAPAGDERPATRGLPAGMPGRHRSGGGRPLPEVVSRAAGWRLRALSAFGGGSVRTEGGPLPAGGSVPLAGTGALHRRHSAWRPFRITIFIRDGAARVWVRDSRLDGCSAQTIVDTLACRLRRNGIGLAGVVVNGMTPDWGPGVRPRPGDIDIQGRVVWQA